MNVEEGSVVDLRRRLGDGQPLDARIAADIGSIYGESFADVRVHTGAAASDLAAAHGALAVAVGNDIAFASGAYQPGTRAGQLLIAHELAHVAQQRGGSLDPHRRVPDDADAAQEHDADHAAMSAVARLHGDPSTALHRPGVRSGLRLAPFRASQQETGILLARFHLQVVATPDVSTAMVGMTIQFHTARVQPTDGSTLFVESWELVQPSGAVRFSGSVEHTAETITEAGPHTMRANMVVTRGWTGSDRQQFTLERRFTAVTTQQRATEQLAGVPDTRYDAMRASQEAQRALLRPPAATRQASGSFRITTSAPNPATADDHGAPIQLAIERTGQGAPIPPDATYRWYARPLDASRLSHHRDGSRAFANLASAEVDGQRGYFDLLHTLAAAPRVGTATVALPTTVPNQFVIVGRIYDARGQLIGEARYLQSVLSDQQRRDLQQFDAHLAREDELARRLVPESRQPLSGVHVATDTGAVTQLNLVAGRPPGGGVTIVDVTPGLDARQHQLEFHGADIHAALAELRARNHYPRGHMRLRLPVPNHLGPRGESVAIQVQAFDTTGHTALDLWSGRLGVGSAVLAGAAAIAAPFTGGTSVAVTVLVLGSAALGVAAAGLSLAERVRHAQIDRAGVALDAVAIAANIVGAAGAFQAIRGTAGIAIPQLAARGRFLLWANFSTATVGALLITEEASAEIIAILADPRISSEDRRLRIASALVSMILNAAIVALGAADVRQARARLQGVLRHEVEAALSSEARWRLSALDDHALSALRGANVQEADRVAALIGNRDPDVVRLVARMGNRGHLLDVLRLTASNARDELELVFLQLRLAAHGTPTQAQTIVATLRVAGVRASSIAQLGDGALAFLRDDAARFARLERSLGDDFIRRLDTAPSTGTMAERWNAAVGRAMVAHHAPNAVVVDDVHDLPIAWPGTTRVYCGTRHPDIPQLSPSMRSGPIEEASSGAEHFMNRSEIHQHMNGANQHPDGISTTTRYDASTSYGTATIVYDVPNEVIESMPPTQAAQSEYVFRYSLPEQWRRGVVRRR